MLNIAVLADMHLPGAAASVQEDVLRFAAASIAKHAPDAVLCLGDITADGTPDAAAPYERLLGEVSVPVLTVLGNSDVRSPARRTEMLRLESADELRVGGVRFLGLHTADGKLSERDRARLLSAGADTVIVMHHPPQSLLADDAAFFARWRQDGAYRLILCGHLHVELREEKLLSVRALDPDKAIGGVPAVTYITLDGDGWNASADEFPDAPPAGWVEFLGLSCFDPVSDVRFAAAERIRNIELRPNAVRADRAALAEAIRVWRAAGGAYLSVHLPDYGWQSGSLTGADEYRAAIRFAAEIGADGVTTHVPKASVCDMASGARGVLLSFVADSLRALPPSCAVGIENMHMTPGERVDDTRRFGYTPPECLDWMRAVRDMLPGRPLGTLLDVGHARNNAPFSQKYPLGAWYSLTGVYPVAYHIHQVTQTADGKMENHMPITDVYGPLISYCGFAHAWNRGQLARRPLFLEIRGGQEQYRAALSCLRTQWKE